MCFWRILSWEQLIRVAEHFDLDVGNKRMKENIKNIIRANLADRGCFGPKMLAAGHVRDSGVSVCEDTTLTFEQRRKLLCLQNELKRLELEERRLSLHARGAAGDLGGCSSSFDNSKNLRLVPQFSKRDPDTFFSLFERIAASTLTDALDTILAAILPGHPPHQRLGKCVGRCPVESS